MGENKWGKHSLHCPRKSCSQSKEKPKNIYLTSAAMFPFVPHPGPQRLSPCKNTLFFFFFSPLIFITDTARFLSVPHWRLPTNECRHLNGTEHFCHWILCQYTGTEYCAHSVPIHWHRILLTHFLDILPLGEYNQWISTGLIFTSHGDSAMFAHKIIGFFIFKMCNCVF